jgi:hypothetical protein
VSFQSLERQIVQAARTVLENPKLKLSEVREWSTDAQTVRENLNHDELLLHLPDPGVWIAVPSTADRRAAKEVGQ